MKFVMVLLLLGFSVGAHAEIGTSKVSKSQLDRLATEFFMFESNARVEMLANLDPHRCEDQQQDGGSGPTCRDTACNFVGAHNCNDLSELEQIGRACRGNVDGRCLQAACNRIGTHNCNTVSEIERVAASCRGHSNEGCLEVSCNYLGAHNCNTIDELEKVTLACRGVRASCVESVCQRIGTHNCNTIEEIEQVAASCRGS